MKEQKNMQLFYQFKSANCDAIALFVCGDFYECYSDDAVAVAKVTGLTLHSRNDKSICGFPKCDLDKHLPKIIKAGLRLGLLDSDFKPKEGEGVKFMAYKLVDEEGKEFADINFCAPDNLKEKEKSYSELDIIIVQEITSLLGSAIYELYEGDKTIYEVNEIIRVNYLQEFKDGYKEELSKEDCPLLELIDTFCDTKEEQLGIKEYRAKKEIETDTDEQVAQYSVLIAEEFSQFLIDNYKEYEDMEKRAELIMDMATRVVDLRFDDDRNTTVLEDINTVIEKKKEELVYSHAKYKVGDYVWIMNWGLEKVRVIDNYRSQSHDKAVVYSLAYDGNEYADYDYVRECEMYDTPEDVVTSLQMKIDNGDFK